MSTRKNLTVNGLFANSAHVNHLATNSSEVVNFQSMVDYVATTGSGTVSSVNTGTGLTGGPITLTGTIDLEDTAVTPGTYTYMTGTVDQQGRLTFADSGTPPTTYTGTTRQIDVLGSVISLPDVVHIGGSDNFSASGLSESVITFGTVQVNTSGNVFRSILSGTNAQVISGTTTLTDVISMGVGDISGGTHTACLYMHTSAANLSGTMAAVLMMGGCDSSGGTKSVSILLGENNTNFTSPISNSICGGKNVSCTGNTVSNGCIVFGADISHSAGNIQEGSMVIGRGHQPAGLFNGVFVAGSNFVNTFNCTSQLYVVQDYTRASSSNTSAFAKKVHDATTSSRTGVFIGGGAQTAGTYYNASFPGVTYLNDTNTPAGDCVSIVAADDVRIASGTGAETRFEVNRPRCSESTLPSTNADDLVSKAFAEAYTAATPAHWATSAPTTIKDALDRLAAGYNAVHGAVP